jgi:hypothetical protein
MRVPASRRRRVVPSALVTSGLTELAAGALSGWVFTVTKISPEAAQALGIRSPARIRQWHLDLAMLGSATVAVGAAVPHAPRSARTALGVGAWTNAMAFLPLAFRPELEQHPAYRAAATMSFAATTVGFCGVAAFALRGRRRR